MKRQEARELAFVIIFEKEINGESIENIIENAKESRDIKINEYITKTVNGVFENIENLDEIIKNNIKGWNISRLSKVTLALLRLAIFEINYNEEVPNSVAINEAVELCKKYATFDDASYLNGVLGAILRKQVKE